ncbi:MAG TPA: DUF4402 domain-containing protein [Sphingomicrobium sp.]|nr:DUF4402 domain-containing protein [Sphingomicrobium sp.]
MRCLAALAIWASPTLASAAAPLAQPTAHVVVLLPLTVTKLQDMDFGILSTTGAGTAVLDPNTDALTTTGPVSSLGGSPHCAQFAGSAGSASVVNIKAPTGSITLTRVGGTETMTVSNFTIQGQSKRALAKAASFTFRVGGTLSVAAGQVEGLYVGTFSVTVQYP